MTVAALVISVLALLVAGASAWFARGQAVAAQTTARIEANRRHEESAPLLTAKIEEPTGGAAYRLKIILEGPRQLSGLTIDIIEGPGSWFTPGQVGVASGPVRPLHAVYAGARPLQVHQHYYWQLEFDKTLTGDPLRLMAHCTGTDDAGDQAVWDVAVTTVNETPYDISRSVY